jgi:hypothetical protein
MPPRPRYEMPEFFREALHARGLMDAYLSRPINKMTTSAGSLVQNRKPQDKSG